MDRSPRSKGETLPSKDGKIKWSSYRKRAGTVECAVMAATLGCTGYTISQTCDVASVFHWFITPEIEKIIVD